MTLALMTMNFEDDRIEECVESMMNILARRLKEAKADEKANRESCWDLEEIEKQIDLLVDFADLASVPVDDPREEN